MSSKRLTREELLAKLGKRTSGVPVKDHRSMQPSYVDRRPSGATSLSQAQSEKSMAGALLAEHAASVAPITSADSAGARPSPVLSGKTSEGLSASTAAGTRNVGG